MRDQTNKKDETMKTVTRKQFETAVKDGRVEVVFDETKNHRVEVRNTVTGTHFTFTVED